MNAYELANEMEAYEDAGMFMKKSANMLRQQADRIAELEEEKPDPRCDKACMYLCQTKPLSDEEIDEIIADCGYQIEETVTGKFVDIEGINMYNSFKGFARAIEAKVRGE